MFDGNDDWHSLFPLFKQLGENFRGVLQIGHEDNDGVAARLQKRVHGGTDVSEVARVADHLDIRVGGGDFAEDSEGGITRRVVDEDVLVAVSPEPQHQVTYAFVDFADIALFVIAGCNYTNSFHCVRAAHLPLPTFAA